MTTKNVINELNAIFIKHAHNRICVVGTMCCGKTTLLKQIQNCVDMDEALFSSITKEEADFLCQTPWTKEIGDKFDRLTYEKVHINPGNPMFGTVIIECEVVVCLDIDDALLKERCLSRSTSFEDAKNMQKAIQKDIDNNKSYKNTVFYHIALS